MTQYLLNKHGVETGPVTSHGAFNATEYRFDPAHDYEVVAWEGDARRPIGSCKVHEGPSGLSVEPDFLLEQPGSFWGVWDVDEEPVAQLKLVLLKRE